MTPLYEVTISGLGTKMDAKSLADILIMANQEVIKLKLNMAAPQSLKYKQLLCSIIDKLEGAKIAAGELRVFNLSRPESKELLEMYRTVVSFCPNERTGWARVRRMNFAMSLQVAAGNEEAKAA